MENAADALKIAFAIFVFVTAITLIFLLISQAKETADVVLYYSDRTNFYEHLDSSDINRKVYVAEVIPELYRYYNETIGIIVKLSDGEVYTFDLNNKETILLEEKTKLGSKKEREENLAKFINDILLELPDNTEFEEEFVEVPISGIYERGEDDTELALSDGGKKVYITYSQI